MNLLPLDEVVSLFETVVTGDPLAAALFVIGNAMLGLAVGVGGLLLLGAIVDVFRGD